MASQGHQPLRICNLAKGNFSPFSLLKIELCRELMQLNWQQLAELFELTPAEIDAIKNSGVSTLSFLRNLIEKGVLSDSNVDGLIAALERIDCIAVANKVRKYKQDHIERIPPESLGGIQPSSEQYGHQDHSLRPTGQQEIGGHHGHVEPAVSSGTSDWRVVWDDTPLNRTAEVSSSGESQPIVVLRLDVADNLGSIAQVCIDQLELIKDKIWQTFSGTFNHLGWSLMMISLYGTLEEISEGSLLFHVAVPSLHKLVELRKDISSGRFAEELQQEMCEDMSIVMIDGLRLVVSLDSQSGEKAYQSLKPELLGMKSSVQHIEMAAPDHQQSSSESGTICFSEYALLKIEFSRELTVDHLESLADLFKLEPGVLDRLREQYRLDNSGTYQFLSLLENRDQFSKDNVNDMIGALEEIKHHKLARRLREYQHSKHAVEQWTHTPSTLKRPTKPQVPSRSGTPLSPQYQSGFPGYQHGDVMYSGELPLPMLDTDNPNLTATPGEVHWPSVVVTLSVSPKHSASGAKKVSAKRTIMKQLRSITEKISQELTANVDDLSGISMVMSAYGDWRRITDSGSKFHITIPALAKLVKLHHDIEDGSLAEDLQQILVQVMMVHMRSGLELVVSLDRQSVKDAVQALKQELEPSGLQEEKYFCDYCKVIFKESWQHEYHVGSQEHQEKIASKQGHKTWAFREPPLSITNGRFEFCIDMLENKCKYFNKKGDQNDCQFAHSVVELEEWREKHENRLEIFRDISHSHAPGEREKTKQSRWMELKRIFERENQLGRTETLGNVTYLDSSEDKIDTGSNYCEVFIGEFQSQSVAVKRVPRTLMQETEALFRKMQNAQLANVLKMECIEKERRDFYVITLLCEWNLSDIIGAKSLAGITLTPVKRLKLCVDILTGLKNLHSLDIIHRDLKPKNVLIDKKGEAYLADFGISRNLAGQSTLMTGAYGTHFWMASEHTSIAEEQKVPHKRESDLQVAGYLIYYILSDGHHPFEKTFPFEKEPLELLHNLTNGKFNLSHMENYPEDCKDLLAKMLRKDLRKRPGVDECLNHMTAIHNSFLSKSQLTLPPSREILFTMADVIVDTTALSVLVGERRQHSWTLKIRSPKVRLKRIYLWHNLPKQFFLLRQSDPTHYQDISHDKLQARETDSSISVTVHFKSEDCGLSHQWVIFDFGKSHILCRQLLAWVGPEFCHRLQPINDASIPWEWSCLVIKSPQSGTPELFEEELKEVYPFPNEDPASFKGMESPTQDNFKDFFHNMVIEEERACMESLNSFNGKQRMVVKDHIERDITLCPNDGQLFGEIPLAHTFDDSEASQILERFVRRVLLKFDQNPNDVYEADILAGRYVDLREFDSFSVCLSQSCVQDQRLFGAIDQEVDVEVQFKIDRLPFCRQRYAIDHVRDSQLLFPPSNMFPRFVEKPVTLQEILLPHTVQDADKYQLNHQQEEAKNFITRARNIIPFRQGPSLIIGPFGTGKTFTLADTIKRIIDTDEESCLLICTHSNSAADMFISEHLQDNPLESHQILRLYAPSQDLRSVPGEIKENYCIFENIDRKKFAKPTRRTIERKRVIITTLSDSLHLVQLKEQHGLQFTHIIIDEAGQALETETMMPLALAGPRTVVILVGDHKQLRPKVFSPLARKYHYHQSMLERLFYWSTKKRCYNIHFLTENYRMCPQILSFIGVHCYQNIHFRSVVEEMQQDVYPIAFSAVYGKETPSGISYYNENEAEVILKEIVKLRDNWPKVFGNFEDGAHIAVLTTYMPQVKHIRTLLRKKGLKSVTVDIVHNVQGKQFQIVFISCVRTRNKITQRNLSQTASSPSAAGPIPSEEDYRGMLTDEGEMITAFTRARSLLFVVGDPVSLCHPGTCKQIWKAYIGECEKNGSLSSCGSDVNASPISLSSIESEISLMYPKEHAPCQSKDANETEIKVTMGSAPPVLQPTLLSSPDETSSEDDETEELDVSNDEEVFDGVLMELDKQVQEERQREDSESATVDLELEEETAEVEELPKVEDIVEPVPTRGKPGERRRKTKFRMLHEDEVSLVKFEARSARANLESGFQEETEEEPEDMSDDQERNYYRKKATDDPYRYCFCVVRFSEDMVYGIPQSAHFPSKIVLTNKRKRKRALDGDEVVVEVRGTRESGSVQGEVMSILRRAEDFKWKKLVCTVDPENIGLMRPIQYSNMFLYPKLFIFPSGVEKVDGGIRFGLYSIAPHSDKQKIPFERSINVRYTEMTNRLFVVQYYRWFDEVAYPMGIVTEELPKCTSLNIGVKILRLRHGVKEKWPSDIRNSVQESFPDSWRIPNMERQSRSENDFRDKPVFTVSQSDYRDLDMALHAELWEDGRIQLGIHISDVSYFVEKDHRLDKEAFERASSFYDDAAKMYPSRMLPDRLSADLCIFKRKEDRLAVSIILTCDSSGEVQEAQFVHSLVCCHQNMTFQQVEKFLLNEYDRDWGHPLDQDSHQVMQQLELLYKLVEALPVQHTAGEVSTDFPIARSIIQKIISLGNAEVAKKLDLISGAKIIRRQLPPNEEEKSEWDATYLDDASLLLEPPLSKMSRSSDVPTSFDLLQDTDEEMTRILKTGKDKIFKLGEVLRKTDGFPRQAVALSQLNGIIPKEEYISTGDLTRNVSHYSLQNDHIYPYAAPTRSYADLVVQRMLVASIEGTGNPYTTDDDLWHIAHHCTRQIDNARAYERSVKMLELAMSLQKEPISLPAIVQSVSDGNLKFSYPFVEYLDDSRSATSVNLRHMKPGKEPERGEIRGKSISWRNRIYSNQPAAEESTTEDVVFQLTTDAHVSHITGDVWTEIVDMVKNQRYDLLESLAEKWPTRAPQQETGEVDEISCEKVKTSVGVTEIKKYVEFKRPFSPGHVVELQLCSEFQHGIPSPKIQLFKLTRQFCVCLEHRILPVECFTEIAEKLPRICENLGEYVDAWLPVLKMLIVYSSIMNDETILIHDVPIKWSKEVGTLTVFGQFALDKKWCDDRQVNFGRLPKQKKGKKAAVEASDPTEESPTLASDYICVRLHGFKPSSDDQSNPKEIQRRQKSNSIEALSKESAFVVHGIAGRVSGNKKDAQKCIIQFEVTQMACELPPELFNGEEVSCTVERIPKAEPERRMEAALVDVGNSGPLITNIILQEPCPVSDELGEVIAEGTKLVEHLDVSSYDGFTPAPNESQKEAISRALTRPFTVIQGPPGTGKTKTGAYITTLFARINKQLSNPEAADAPRPQILYCGPSNKSVDVIAVYLQRLKSKSLKFVRVYSDFLEQQDFPIPGVESAERKFTYDVENTQTEEMIKECALHHLIRSGEEGKQVKDMYKRLKNGKITPSLQNIRRYNWLANEAKKMVLKQKDVILCTCNAAGHYLLMENLNIVQCIIDEAGMCFELDTLVPLVSQKPTQVVLIGDHKQLRPIIQEPRVRQLGAEMSLMEKYGSSAYTLKTQYRMHEEICSFPSKEFYQDQLVTDRTVIDRRPFLQPDKIWPGTGHCPRVFCHIEGKEDMQTVKTAEGNENSRSNAIEADEVVRIANYLVNRKNVDPKDIVILSQYRLQCRKIQGTLKKMKDKMRDIKVQTIIKSQGSEWDFVILSTVRSLPEEEIPELPGKSWRRMKLGFIEDENQMNVGLTRAMQGLIIVGNKNLLATCKKWRELIKHYQQTKSVVPAKSFARR